MTGIVGEQSYPVIGEITIHDSWTQGDDRVHADSSPCALKEEDFCPLSPIMRHPIRRVYSDMAFGC